METKLTIIDPKEFGLKEENVKNIEKAFLPKIAEREGLEIIYKELISSEITEELCNRAKETRNQLVKVRTGIAQVHKTQKAFFLASGKFVDAWKNKETLPVVQMEEKLLELEKHFENIEKERIQKLQESRMLELEKFEPDYIPDELGMMNENVWDNFRNGVEMNYKFIKQTELIAEQKRITAEKKAEYDSIEKERITQLEKDRMIVAAPLSSFIADFENIVFADLAEYKFSNLISKALRLKNEQEHKQEQIKVENERLKREVEEKERVAKEYEQRREAEKQKNHDRMKALTSIGLIFNGELFVYRDINFNWTDISCMNDHEFSKALEGADVRMTEIKLDEQKEKEKEHAKQEAERLDIQRLENELNLKIKAEQKAESDRLSEIEAELKKDDYVKVKDLLNDLESLKTKYSFKLPDNQKMYSGVGVLLDKIKNHIK